MSNTTKPKGYYTEATGLNDEYTDASLRIKEARNKINTLKTKIAAEEEVILKAKLIKSIINGETPIYEIAPIIPESWENNPKLKSKYEDFIQFIENNPKWWIEWGDKIELKDEGIDFKELHFILDLDDLPETKNWYELINKNMMDSIPNLREFRVINSFINFAGSKNRAFLKDFLGLTANLYWSSTEFDSKRAHKILLTSYASDIIDSKENFLNIKTGKRY